MTKNLRVVDEADEHEAEHERRVARRRGGEAGAAEIIGDILGHAMANAPALDDDAAWAARDAKIQADKDRVAAGAERARLETRAAVWTADHDFPERAVMVATAPDKTAPVAAALEWAPTTRKNILVLSGDQGIGKSVAACAHALRSSYTVWRYVRAATFQATSRFDRARREDYSAGSLILDDLGAEYMDGKGAFLADLDELVDFYYSRPSRTLIITTNVSARDTRDLSAKGKETDARGDFARRYGSERLLGRLREAAVWREFGGAPCLRPAPATPRGGAK